MQRLNVMPMAKSLFFLGRKIIPRRLLYAGFRRKVDANSSGLSRDAHSGRGTWEGFRAQEAAGPREQSSARLPAEAYRVLALPAPPPQLLTESSPSCVESPRTNAEKDSELGEKGGGLAVTSLPFPARSSQPRWSSPGWREKLVCSSVPTVAPFFGWVHEGP